MNMASKSSSCTDASVTLLPKALKAGAQVFFSLSLGADFASSGTEPPFGEATTTRMPASSAAMYGTANSSTHRPVGCPEARRSLLVVTKRARMVVLADLGLPLGQSRCPRAVQRVCGVYET